METYGFRLFFLGPWFVYPIYKVQFEPLSQYVENLDFQVGLTFGISDDWNLVLTSLRWFICWCLMTWLQLPSALIWSIAFTIWNNNRDPRVVSFQRRFASRPSIIKGHVRASPCCPWLGLITGTIRQSGVPTQNLLFIVTGKDRPASPDPTES